MRTDTLVFHSFCRILTPLLLFTIFISCSVEKKQNEIRETPISYAPKFNADSAYSFVEKQVSFGPRVPGTASHSNASKYFEQKLTSYGWKVFVQNFNVTTFDNHSLQLKNIIASYKPELKRRVLLAAHWDTRPFADKDQVNKNATFDGANDGASGVAVLLEIARAMQDSISAPVGVDIIFFDGEDWGERDGEQDRVDLPKGLYSWWCLGSQHWSQNKYPKNYSAMYGILIDMVGARRAQFWKESGSMQYAPGVVNKVWNTGARLGYSDYFISKQVDAITDDHVFVNELGKIPMIDIVPYQPETGFFGSYHHTQSDNLAVISKETLLVVGNTLLQVIYSEE